MVLGLLFASLGSAADAKPRAPRSRRAAALVTAVDRAAGPAAHAIKTANARVGRSDRRVPLAHLRPVLDVAPASEARCELIFPRTPVERVFGAARIFLARNGRVVIVLAFV